MSLDNTPHCEQFSLELLSTEDTVPKKTVDSKLHGWLDTASGNWEKRFCCYSSEVTL